MYLFYMKQDKNSRIKIEYFCGSYFLQYSSNIVHHNMFESSPFDNNISKCLYVWKFNENCVIMKKISLSSTDSMYLVFVGLSVGSDLNITIAVC